MQEPRSGIFAAHKYYGLGIPGRRIEPDLCRIELLGLLGPPPVFSVKKVLRGLLTKFIINPQAPVAQISADEVVFRHFQGEGVEFF